MLRELAGESVEEEDVAEVEEYSEESGEPGSVERDETHWVSHVQECGALDF